ncbi:FkbM family methyltransferase [Nocardioides jiangxiensis]|uniref:FkbM family methyltransferase n=1 Tax=Nocardioides jiangxiensis TaxID=3064524 RepID=A0ABT9B3X6_9ACTN|nr:FkbM family methyltransferase [Nocardioides sp. WY-20]MDO7867858.1 FkbM family methyltransferase [Nocardioides sp. WY-20]
MSRRMDIKTLPRKVRQHASWAVRDRFPNRKVVRNVQGTYMVLPWSHRLPDYTGEGSVYGQNLVELAKELGAGSTPLTVLDVGANVGDSTLQILDAVDGKVLCVEGDSAYLEFLHINTDRDQRVTVVEALLSTDGTSTPVQAVRSGGTTRFEVVDSADAIVFVTAEQLRERYADFATLRLAKSDTDGYDVALIPMIAEAWKDQPPVLFFEYDHALSRLAGNEPLEVWGKLGALGYRDVAVWDNAGLPLGRTTVDQIGALASVLDHKVGLRAQHYWDVAVVHPSDAEGLAAIEKLVPGPLTDPR